MGRLGYLQTLASADSGESFLRGLQLLSFLAARDARLLRSYEGSLAELAVKEKNLATLRASIAVVAGEARDAERELQRARAEKAALLARLERSAEEQRTNVAVLEDKTSRLAALLELLETRGRALPAGAASIRRYKGALDWPARGKVVVPFGRIANPRFPRTFLRSSGWTIDVPTGTPVKAVFAGDVVYAQWLKGYGNLVVLDHGDGVFTLYGHLMTGTAPRGTRVALGEAVGRVADPPKKRSPGSTSRSARAGPPSIRAAGSASRPRGPVSGLGRRRAAGGNRPGAIPYHWAVTKSRLAPFLGSLALLGTLFVVLPGLGADEKKEKGGGACQALGLYFTCHQRAL